MREIVEINFGAFLGPRSMSLTTVGKTRQLLHKLSEFTQITFSSNGYPNALNQTASTARMRRERGTSTMKLRYVSVAVLAMASALAQAPDNTKINKRDDVKNPVTADKQSNNKADLDLVRKIRQEITQDKSLSTYARNVKIITRDGMTTLRGPVKSDAEKQTIEAVAKRLTGAGKVESHLEIAPPK